MKAPADWYLRIFSCCSDCVLNLHEDCTHLNVFDKPCECEERNHDENIRHVHAT